MKLLMKLYDRCKTPIRVLYFAFILIAFGTLVKSDSVNIFYTIRNSFVLMFAEGCLKLGQTIVVNSPLIFMANLVCKRANSGVPIVLCLIGYFTFILTTSIFTPQNLMAQAYLSSNSFLSLTYGDKLPLETGLVGAFVVALMVRIAFIHSRNRTSHSILGFLKKDSAAIIYTIVLCSFSGIIISYVFPFCYQFLAKVINYIARDLKDPFRMGMYGVLDRVMNMLGMGTAVRYPFWFTSLGGSYQTVAGQSILGDVNIWNNVKDMATGFDGAGRFVTGYYLINMFVIPGLCIGALLSMTNRKEQGRLLLPCLFASLLSIVCGNPLPYELMMIFMSPLLLSFYLVVVWMINYILTSSEIYFGSVLSPSFLSASMPGSFPDLIISIRNVNHYDTILSIFSIGICVFIAVVAFSMAYYRYFAGGVRLNHISNDIVDSVGGLENISDSASGFYRLDLSLVDVDAVSFDKLRKLESYRVIETRDGISLEYGVASFVLAKKIKEKLKNGGNTSPAEDRGD